MRGFKSFADKTLIDFDNGVTCVVGPNGSGKSNITDAVRWVLGEQRAKTLRGSKMEDVIFNGTNRRKKLGMAEVTLVFDNSERYFALDYNEVKVCRRVYRSGESEYILNDTNCRLKDVRDLFMDTGIGTDGYSIIGQGRIESVLSNNIDERRQLFEEAAGIVKYKTRKRDTERKLDNTEANLLRIEDIFSELEGRVEPLRIESEKAKRHIELTDRLSELELNLFINEIESVDKKLMREQAHIDEVTVELNKNSTSQKHLFDRKSQLNQQIETSTQELQSLQNSFFEDKNEIVNIEGEMNVVTAKLESNASEDKRLNSLLQEHQIKLDQVKSSKETVISKQAETKETIESYTHEIASKQATFESLSKDLYDNQALNETKRQAIINKMNEIERHKSEINSYHTIMASHQSRKDALNDEINEAEEKVAETKSRETDLDHQLNGLRDSKTDLMNKEKSLKDVLTSIKETIQKENILLGDHRKKLTEFTTESNLLKQMEKDHAGYDQSVKKTLSLLDQKPNLKKGLNGVVASLMEIPKDYEVALEVALGKSIQNLVVEAPSDAKAIIAELKRIRGGRVTFIPLSSIRSKGDNDRNIKALEKINGYIGKANELFDYDSKYNVLFDYLVGRTIIVDTVDTATEALKIKDLKYKVITLEGDVFIPGGTITGGSYRSKSSGILSRKRKIVELDDHIKREDQAIEKLTDTLQKLRDDEKENSYEYQQTLKIKDGVHVEILKKENEQNSIKDEIARQMTLISKRKSETIIIDNDIKSVQDSVETRQQAIEVLSKENALIEAEIVTENQEADTLKIKVQNIREALTETKVKNASLLEVYKNYELDIERYNKDHDELLALLETDEKAIQAGRLSKNLLSGEFDALNKKKEAIISQSGGKHQLIEKLQADVSACEKEIKKINDDNKELFDYIESLKDQLHRVEIKRAKYDVHRDDIANRLYERYEISPEEAILRKKDIDMSSANKEIKGIKKELKDIGDVNLLAVEEYEEVYERYHFLKEQHDDLVEARNSLKKLVRELEKEMKEKFMETFDVVKVHFSEIFESLFVGGVAELAIADPENILESDIQINVQPPGKKLQNITLLSGGEKALTAIALLFAILKTKPAPFCILDEIEAALDDVNVYRFADFLKEFTRNSQFVIITHRKGTMEIADNLFGVTMQEFGISKMISVKLEDAILE